MTDHYIPGVDRVEPGAAVVWQGRKVGEVVKVDDDGTIELSLGPGAHGLFGYAPGAAYSIGEVTEIRPEERLAIDVPRPLPRCPECAAGKPDNCAGRALDPVLDEFVACEGPA